MNVMSAMKGSLGKSMINNAYDGFQKISEQLEQGIKHCNDDIKNNQDVMFEAQKKIVEAQKKIAELEDSVIKANALKNNISKLLGVNP